MLHLLYNCYNHLACKPAIAAQEIHIAHMPLAARKGSYPKDNHDRQESVQATRTRATYMPTHKNSNTSSNLNINMPNAMNAHKHKQKLDNM